MRNSNRNPLTVLGILTSLVLIIAGVGFEGRTSAQKPVKHPDGSTTTSEDVSLGLNGYGTKETTKDKDGKKTKEETKDEKGTVVERVEYGANGTVRIWRYDRFRRVVFFVMMWTHGGPFGDEGAVGREIKYKNDSDTTGTAKDYARVGMAVVRPATDDEITFLGVAIKTDPLATPNQGSNQAPGKEQPAINVESIIGDLFPSEKKKPTEPESPKSGTSEPQTQPAPKPIPKFQIDLKYKIEFKTSPGLNTETFVLPSGTKISVNFPNDMSAGDTFTGTVLTEVVGKDEKQRVKNQAELEKIVLQIGGQPTRATEKIFTRTIPTNINAAEPFLVVMVNGKQAASATVPIAKSQPDARTIAQNLQLPTGGQMGIDMLLMAPCNGVFDPTDSVRIGGTELQPLAESPRMKVFQNTSPVAGRTQIEFNEGGRITTGPFQNIGVRLSGDTNLLRGQQGPLNLVIFGLLHTQQALPVDLVNASTTVVGVSGGDIQHFQIQPAEISPNGEWARNFTMTGRSAGVFNITATVRWKNPCSMGLADCEGPPPQCGTGAHPCGEGLKDWCTSDNTPCQPAPCTDAHPCGEGLKYWCTGDDKPCEPPPCGAGAHQCGEGLKYWCTGDDKPCQPPPCGEGAHRCGEGLKYWCTGDDKPCQPPGPGPQPTPTPAPSTPQQPAGNPAAPAKRDETEELRKSLASINELLDKALKAITEGKNQDASNSLTSAESKKSTALLGPPFGGVKVAGLSVGEWLYYMHTIDKYISDAKANLELAQETKDANPEKAKNLIKLAKENIERAKEYKKSLEERIQ